MDKKNSFDKEYLLDREKGKIAELIGILVGDGYLHKTEYQIVISGSLDDYDYYIYYLIPLINKLFNYLPQLVKDYRKNAYYLIINSKEIFNFFHKGLGLKRGKKKDIETPIFILNKEELIPDFLRGLLDTDGCIKFSKQLKNINYYPRIRLGLEESPLSLNLGSIIKKTGFNFCISVDKRTGLLCYEISGQENLKKWMALIGTSNPVNLTKYLIWRKVGYVEPKTSLEERKQIIKEIFIKEYRNKEMVTKPTLKAKQKEPFGIKLPEKVDKIRNKVNILRKSWNSV